MMRKLLLFLATFCLATLLMSSCNDDSEQSPDGVFIHELSKTVDAAEGIVSITVFTTHGWQSTSDSWITVKPQSAPEGGIHLVHLNYTQNQTSEPRTGHVTFQSGSYSEMYSINQKAN